MFSQSCNYLPNKKQSLLGNKSSQNMGLFRGLTGSTYQGLTDHMSPEFTNPKENNALCIGPRTKNLGFIGLVHSFAETSRFEFGRRFMPSFSVPSEKSKLNCKELFDLGLTHCNTMTSPLVRSYLVGGYVGSKSQIGRKRENNVGKLNLWDIICDLANLVGRTPGNHSQIPNQDKSSHSDKKCDTKTESRPWLSLGNETSSKNFSDSSSCLENPSSSVKNSYADVAKRSTKDHSVNTTKKSEDQLIFSSDDMCDRTSVMEPNLFCCNFDHESRDRITSECSADSEDSYIVFECCEDDTEIFSSGSDDDTLSCEDEVSLSDSGIVPSSNASFISKQPAKKVRFVEDSRLVKIHPMVTWDFAYRMARKGPWEMLARDSERFKHRIAKAEAVLKPVLDPQHRSAVYHDRFAGLAR